MTFSEEKELEYFRSKLLDHILQKIKKNLDKAPVVEVLDIQLKAIGSQESFMLTTCYRATVSVKINGREEERLYVVKKTPEIPPEFYESIGFKPLFENEIHTYSVILPAIEEFTQETFVAPEYIYSDTEQHFGIIILEDFKVKGWQVCLERYDLSLEHILLAVKYLGKFHGIGFALKETNRDLFDILKSPLKESRYLSDEIHPDFLIQCQTGTKRLRKVTEKYHPEIEEEFLNKLTTLLAHSFKYGKARVQPVEPMATICHGDYLRNNLAFKYDEANNPTDIMMFDLQTMRYSSPMIDLSVLLSLSSFAHVRLDHFEAIFSTYCEHLKLNFEKYSGKPVPNYLSYESLVKEYIAFLPHSTHIAGFFLMNLIQPYEMSSDEFVTLVRSQEEIEHEGLTRGGELLDKELACQVHELYTLSKKYQVDFTKGFESFFEKL